MTAQRAAASPLRRGATSRTDLSDAAAYCTRPACGKEYRRVIQPGRPQLYCCQDCRRQAEHEVRQLRSRLRDLQASVDQHRRLLAAYGTEESDAEDEQALHAEAQRAVARAGGVLRFLSSSEDPAADEFRALYTAVAPFYAGP